MKTGDRMYLGVLKVRIAEVTLDGKAALVFGPYYSGVVRTETLTKEPAR